MAHDPFKFTGQIIRVLDGEEVCYHGFNQRIADLFLHERPNRRLEIRGEPQLTASEIIAVTEVLAECRRFEAEQHLRQAVLFTCPPCSPENEQVIALAS